ncbi:MULTISPECIES: outer membrane protein [unclassified Bartonella]|uniref:outer membrane protein n=1 Tax=unclassified Bartonella TaxID=2645622 RepID=UPI00235E1A9E|nr:MULTISPECIES: outer membrane protein [unclassified Bartonella]
MTTKYLITTSLFSLTLISVVQAADIRIPEQPASVVPIIAAPSFSWTGFYLGGQIGNFSSKTRANYLRDEKTGQWFPIDKEYLPKLSGFIGGIYAGSNIDVDNGFIVGIDTDIMWVNKKDTKEVGSPKGSQTEEAAQSSEKSMRAKGSREDPSPPPPETSSEIIYHTLKQKWTGATRVRFGVSIDRFMPYVAGGIAYTQLRSIFSKDSDIEKRAINLSDWLEDEKKTMIGYTLGGGVDFAMTDNIVMRAEYRYSDFGKKKFVHDKVEMRYKTNDFRVGVAYKF